MQQKLENLLGSIAGGSETTKDHSDKSRSAVGWTAFVVALFRAAESSKPNSRFKDKPTEDMFNLFHGTAPLSSRISFFLLQKQLYTAHFYPKNLRSVSSVFELFQRIILTPITFLYGSIIYHSPRLSRGFNWLVVRTEFIDSQLLSFYNEIKNKSEGDDVFQIVILGAGLDSRPLRLQQLYDDEGGSHHLKVKFFEIDFPGMLEARRHLFKDYQSVSERITQISIDLTAPNWEQKLKENGFDPNMPAVFILEGLTAYLTDEELSSVFKGLHAVTDVSNIPQSKLIISTWLVSFLGRLKLHRSNCPNGLMDIENYVKGNGTAEGLDWQLRKGLYVTSKSKKLFDILPNDEKTKPGKEVDFLLASHIV